MDGTFLYNPDGCGLYCHAPSLLSTCAGSLLVSWYAYEQEEHLGARLVLARKPRGAANWSGSTLVFASSPYSTGNPVLFEDEPGCIWLLFVALKGGHWNAGELQGAYSRDDGQTWSAAATLWPTLGLMVRHPPVQAHGSGLLLPAYDEERRQAVVLERGAGDSRWRELHRFDAPPLLQPVLVRDAPSRLSMFFRPWSDPRVVWRSHSTSEGRQWSTPVRTTLPCPLSGIGAFAVSDRVAVVHNHTERHARSPLSVSTSRDGGLSWSEPWHFETISHEVSYPQFLVSEAGDVHGVYSYNRKVIKYVHIEAGELP